MEDGLLNFAGVVEQDVIDAPGIGADAFEREAGAGGFAEAFLEFKDEVRDVPAERTSLAHGGIREAVKFLQRQPAILKRAGDEPTALRAEIASEVMSLHFSVAERRS